MQPELQLNVEPVDDKNVRWLEELLLDAGNWMTAAEILDTIGFKHSDDNKRLIRRLASASEVVLSGPGSPGYKHLKNCKIEEAKHYANAGISQGREMVHRSIRILRSAHKIIG